MVAIAVKAPVDFDTLLHTPLKLTNTTRLTTHTHRKIPWPIIYDELNDVSFYISRETYHVVGKLNGIATVHTILNDFKPTINSETAAIDSTSNILLEIITLYQSGLLTGYFSALENSNKNTTDHNTSFSFLFQCLRSPFSQKLTLFDGNKISTSLLDLFNPILIKKTLIAAITLIITAIILGMYHSDQLLDQLAGEFQHSSNMLTLALLYVPLKAIHEFSHGVMTKKFGGHVGKFGIVFFVLLPIPYVDVSSSARLINKHQRMAIAAAGIFAELIIASIAFILFIVLNESWFATHYATGYWLKNLLFDIAFIGFVSSLLFNANPLLRFDGYYVFSDWLEIPNLATRARQILSYKIQTGVFSLKKIGKPTYRQSETSSLLIYAVAAIIYKIFIFTIIVSLMTTKLWWLGFLLFIIGTWNQWLYPAIKNTLKLYIRAQQEQKSIQFALIMSTSILSCTLLFFIIPIQNSTTANGVTDRKTYSVRADIDGFIVDSFTQSGDSITKDDALIEINNPELDSKFKLYSSKLIEADIKWRKHLITNPSLAQTQALAINNIKNTLNNINQKLNSQVVTAPSSGTVEIESKHHLTGRFITKGQEIAQIIQPKSIIVDVLIHQRRLSFIENSLISITVIPNTLETNQYSVKIQTIIPQATKTLPSNLFSSKHGGGIETNNHKGQLVSNESWFVVKLVITTETPLSVIPHRWQVRFSHEGNTLAEHVYKLFFNWFLEQMS